MTRPLRPRLPAGEYRVRLGNYEFRKRGARRFDISDPYRLSVTSTWQHFILSLVGAELLLNLVFALFYLARPGSIANARPGSLLDAFFFSIETLATVGYGEMYPADLYGHVVSAVEIVTGTGFIAVVTGLIFVRVSRPVSPFLFPDKAVIALHHGRPTLMIRVASERLGVLYDAEARLSMLAPEQPADGSARDVADMRLLRASIPVLGLSWTIMHVIDEASPLAGTDPAAIAASGLRFFLVLKAEDPLLGATVRDLRAFGAADIHHGMRYARAQTVGDDGHTVLDLDRLGLIEPDGPPPPAPSGDPQIGPARDATAQGAPDCGPDVSP